MSNVQRMRDKIAEAQAAWDQTETSDIDDVLVPMLQTLKLVVENIEQQNSVPNRWLLDNGTDVFLALKRIQELDGLGAGRNTITAAVTSLVYEMERDLMQ